MKDMKEVNDYVDKEIIKSTKDLYVKAVEDIVNLFMKKHNCICQDWVSGEIGGVIECSGQFYNFSDIKYDLFNDVPAGFIEEWNDASLEAYYRKDEQINFSSWVKGARY